MRDGILFVNYHYVRPQAAYPYPGIHGMTPAQMGEQLDGLKGKTTFLVPEEAQARLLGRGNASGLCITFDDGLKEHFVAAKEVLEPRGIRGFFFLCSRPSLEGRALSVHKMHWLRAHTEPSAFADEFRSSLPEQWQGDEIWNGLEDNAASVYVYDTSEVAVLKYLIGFVVPGEVVDAVGSDMLRTRGIDEREFCQELYLSDDEVRELAQSGHLIGAHGHSHYPVTRLGDAELEAEFSEAERYYRSCLGTKPEWYSYPYGRSWALPEDTAAFSERFGYRFCLSLDNGWCDGTSSLHRLQRINNNELSDFI